jgi:hypothetical protein
VRKGWPKPWMEPNVEHTWMVDIEAANKLLKERDEYEAMEEGAHDLIRLERYYRRT